MERFNIVKKGYDVEEVERYIVSIEQSLTHYKDKDNAIKNAIISAQVAADSMVRNAKNQADEYKTQIVKELAKVTAEVERQRGRIRAFQDVYTNLVQTYLKDIEANGFADLFARLDDVDRMVERLKELDVLPAPTPGEMPMPKLAFDGGVPVTMGAPQSETVIPVLTPPSPAGISVTPQLTPPPLTPPKPPAPPLSLGPSSVPSLNNLRST